MVPPRAPSFCGSSPKTDVWLRSGKARLRRRLIAVNSSVAKIDLASAQVQSLRTAQGRSSIWQSTGLQNRGLQVRVLSPLFLGGMKSAWLAGSLSRELPEAPDVLDAFLARAMDRLSTPDEATLGESES
jgi:hypothetical protein